MRKIFAVAVAGFWCCAASHAWAGLSVTPGIIEMIASPGSEATGTCKIKNSGKEKTTVQIEPENWKQGLKGSKGAGDKDVSEWLTVQPLTLNLNPGKEGEITYKVRIPQDAGGEYTAQIFCSEQAGGGSTEIRARVGIVLYVAIRETIVLDAEISHASVSASRDGDKTVMLCQASVRNRGNVHVRPTGKVHVYDDKGNFQLAVVLKTGWGILPGETYTYQGTGNGPLLKAGKYKAVFTIDYGKLFKQDKSYTKEVFFALDGQGKIQTKP